MKKKREEKKKKGKWEEKQNKTKHKTKQNQTKNKTKNKNKKLPRITKRPAHTKIQIQKSMLLGLISRMVTVETTVMTKKT